MMQRTTTLLPAEKWCSRCKTMTRDFTAKSSYCRDCTSYCNKLYKIALQNDPIRKEASNAYHRLRYHNNLDKYREYERIKYNKNKIAYATRGKIYRFERRIKLLDMYGGVCNCCGQNQFEFLSIDHIYGGGRQHKKSFTSQNTYWNWLLAEKREGFRALCHNCNQSLGAYGYCPHKVGST